MNRFLKWLFFATKFTFIYFFFSALAYAAIRTDRMFGLLAGFWFFVIVASFFIYVLIRPSELREQLKAHKALEPKKPVNREISKGWKTAGIIIGIIDILIIGFVVFLYVNHRDFPDQREFSDLHEGEKFVSTADYYNNENELAKWELNFTSKGHLEFCYYRENTTLTRDISWVVKEEDSTDENGIFLGTFFPKQQLIFKEPFQNQWITLDIIYDDKTNTILRMEGDGFVFFPINR